MVPNRQRLLFRPNPKCQRGKAVDCLQVQTELVIQHGSHQIKYPASHLIYVWILNSCLVWGAAIKYLSSCIYHWAGMCGYSPVFFDKGDHSANAYR